MGRTLPTIVQLIQDEQALWKDFRRTLRREDQDVFDALWRHARRHAAPLAMAARPLPMEGILMAMLVGLARRVEQMEKGGPVARKEFCESRKSNSPMWGSTEPPIFSESIADPK